MSFDQYAPYGSVVESSLRVVTWNVWGRYGQWQERQAAIEESLAAANPDIVCLVESWSSAETTQAKLIAAAAGRGTSRLRRRLGPGRLGFGHRSGFPLAARAIVERRKLRGEDDSGVGEVLAVTIGGDRGPVQFFAVMLDYPLGASVVRQAQVRELAQLISSTTHRRHPIVVCGDFNAGPDSDEIRMLTGHSATAEPGLVFYDAWEVAGDGTAGITWSNRNPLAAVALYPDRRFDYVLSAWPRLGGVGHPTHCELLGVVPNDQLQLSDHYGVLADLRY